MGRGRIAAAMLAAALALVGVRLTAPRARQVLRLRHERTILARRVFELARRNEELRARIARLRSDDLFLEELARERLGLVRDGEIVYRFPRSGSARP